MEFTLTICQKQIHDNFPGLDIKDAGIIDFLGRFSHDCAKKIEHGKVYYWFDYGKVATECPLLRLESEAIRKRMRVMCSMKIFEAHPENRGGKIFFAFGEKYSLTHRDKKEKEREENPDLIKKRTGRKSRPQRDFLPVLPQKEREENPDNHKDHSNHNNQSSEPEIDVADGLKIEIHSDDLDDLKLLDFLPSEQKEKTPPSSALPPNKEKESPAESSPRRYEAFDIDVAAAELKGNEFSAENFARITGTPRAQMVERFAAEVDVFVLEQKGKKSVYNRFDEFSGHFFNYERAKVRSGRNNQPGNQAQVRNGTQQPQSTLPKFLQNQIGK